MEANDTAFCPLLWQANGGRLGVGGKPLLERGERVKGTCSRPNDCYTCPLIQSAVASLPEQGAFGIWVCPDCSFNAPKEAKSLGINLRLAGYYTEGYCQRPNCGRAANLEGDEATAARHSILLQLVLIIGNQIP